MYGIEKLKEAIAVAINIGEGFDKRLEDGKISLMEWLTFIPKLFGIKDIIKNAKEIWAEIQDLDDVERDEIIDFVEEEFDITNDKVEDYIEKAFAIIISISSFIKNEED